MHLTTPARTLADWHRDNPEIAALEAAIARKLSDEKIRDKKAAEVAKRPPRKKKRNESEEKRLNRHYLNKYGISIEQYRDKLGAQADACAICRTHFAALRNKLAVDHCHTTHNVRGLLCTACNLGLGAFKDDPTLLKRAVSYLFLYQ